VVVVRCGGGAVWWWCGVVVERCGGGAVWWWSGGERPLARTRARVRRSPMVRRVVGLSRFP
ncbi:MAG: hypothetical protein ABI112_03665, partial [Terracoccus sp.]